MLFLSNIKYQILNYFQDIHEKIFKGKKVNMNVNDKTVQDIVAYALLSINEQQGLEKLHMLSKIINASKQVK